MIWKRALFALTLVGCCSFAPAQVRGEDLFSRRVAPILRQRCFSCHNAIERKGDVSLANLHDLTELGYIVPGGPDASDLLEIVTPVAGKARMPKGADPLSSDEIAALRQWIAEGAVWPAGLELTPAAVTETDWWSLRPLLRPTVPQVSPQVRPSQKTPLYDGVLPLNDIDAFVAAKHAEMGLSFAPTASRRALIRRLYFDLVGLPPAPAEIEQFVADDAPDAYDRLVDRLLASPHYGERWARHWLDVVHYADTHGYDKDKPRPYAWPYRDYVIRSFNADKPWGRFVEEQVAGDALFPGTRDGIEALGFLAAGPWDYIGHAELPETKIDGKIARHLDRDDMVRTAVQSFNSLTVGCAQCHNHKFDPITQEDYYSLHAVFAAIDRADRAYDPDPQVASDRLRLTRQVQAIDAETQSLRAVAADSIAPQLAVLDEQIEQIAGGEGNVNNTAKQEVERLRSARERLIDAAITPAQQARLQQLVRVRKDCESTLVRLPKPLVGYIGAVYTGSGGNFIGTGASGGKPRVIHLLNRGDITQPRAEVGPGTLSVFGSLPSRFNLPPEHTEAERRAALARWFSSRDNHLTWRSIVNRVWQHHFGRGLVETPDDFGRMGAVPTHPELLDWLAIEFRDSGQSLKALHRLIVTSHTYRQSSTIDYHASAAVSPMLAVDADNRYLWRMNRRKLDAEAIRDAMLSVSGRLDPTLEGPAFHDFVIDKPQHSPHYEYHQHDPNDPRSHRRSVYRFIVRSQLHPFMNALDCADPSLQVGRRNESITPLQALALLNDGIVASTAKAFAAHLEAQGGSSSQRIARGFYRATGRLPSDDEMLQLSAYAADCGFENYCRLLFNLNEFAFVD